MPPQMLMPAKSEIQRCWDVLPHLPGTVTRVFARNRDTGDLDGDYVRSATEMYHFAEVNVDKQCYVCPNPATGLKGTRHTAKDVSHWSYLLIDCDPIDDVFDAEPALEEALLWLGEWMGRDFGPRGVRPLIIDSGRGRQAWIRLNDYPFIDGDGSVLEPAMMESALAHMRGDEPRPWLKRSEARRVNGYWLGRLADKLGLCHGCKVDTSTSDLPRPMRMPGSFNQKTGRMASIIEPGTGPYGGLGELLFYGTPIEKLSDPPMPKVVAGQPWQKVVHLLTKTAKDYLKEGKEEPGRHKVSFHTAKKLCELGVSRDEARRALRQANKKRGPSQELSAEEVEHALDTGYGED